MLVLFKKVSCSNNNKNLIVIIIHKTRQQEAQEGMGNRHIYTYSSINSLLIRLLIIFCVNNLIAFYHMSIVTTQ